MNFNSNRISKKFLLRSFLMLLISILLFIAGCSSSQGNPQLSSYYGSTVLNSFTPSVMPGLKLVWEKKINNRLLQLEFKTPALNVLPQVYVLLPSNYYSDPTRRYPTLYIFHGGSAGPNTGNEYKEWINNSPLVSLTSNLNLICVMPEGGSGGWYTNWYNSGKGGPPEWENFHIRQLVPYIDSHFRTIKNRNERATMGESMGGYGAMEYAAKFPELFGTAISFSGAVDIAEPPNVVGPLASFIIGVMAKGDGATKQKSPFGNFNKNFIVWQNHDPTDLVKNLSNTNLYLYTGNGTPGPLDTTLTATALSENIENIVYLSTMAFYNALTAAGIHPFLDYYGNGTHSWPYWDRDLESVLPMLMNDFKQENKIPRLMIYKSADTSFSQWGYKIEMKRKIIAFSSITINSNNELTFSGVGTATITTPPIFQPGKGYEISYVINHKTTHYDVTANENGSLVFEIKLSSNDKSTTAYIKIKGGK
jgi:S-formylglutathione hydrolase FrmB